MARCSRRLSRYRARFSLAGRSEERGELRDLARRLALLLSGMWLGDSAAVAALDIVFVPPGNLEGDLDARPESHMFVKSKAPWYEITDRLPQHEEYPPGFDAPPVQRPVVEPKMGVVQGSCVCGDVAYEMTGLPMRVHNCHCSRCRRGRSAAHATNAFYPLEQFRWVRGEERIVDYRAPGARYFGIAFCRRCGGGVARASLERGIVAVPLGALDSDPQMRPQSTSSSAPRRTGLRSRTRFRSSPRCLRPRAVSPSRPLGGVVPLHAWVVELALGRSRTGFSAGKVTHRRLIARCTATLSVPRARAVAAHLLHEPRTPPTRLILLLLLRLCAGSDQCDISHRDSLWIELLRGRCHSRQRGSDRHGRFGIALLHLVKRTGLMRATT